MKNVFLSGTIALTLLGCPDYKSGTPSLDLRVGEGVSFASDVTLEVYAFHASPDISCASLNANPKKLPADAAVLAREKADSTNNGGEVAFLLEHLPTTSNHIIFVRALELASQVVYASGCEENIATGTGENREIHLYLKTHHQLQTKHGI